MTPSTLRQQLAALERRLARTVVGDPTYEDTTAPLVIFGSPANSASLLFVTKPNLAERIHKVRVAQDCLIITKYGLPSKATVDAIHWFADTLDLPVGFIGDLDVHDVASFAALSYSVQNSRQQRQVVRWLGLSHEWLGAVKRFMRKPFTPEMLLIKEIDLEMRRWEIMNKRWPQVRSDIGEGNASFLDSGFKIEVEGLTNSRLYRSGHLETLVASLLSK